MQTRNKFLVAAAVAIFASVQAATAGSLKINGVATDTWKAEIGQSIPTGTMGFLSGTLVAGSAGFYTFTYGGGGLLAGDTGHGDSLYPDEFWVGTDVASAEAAGHAFCTGNGGPGCSGQTTPVGQQFTVYLPAGNIPFGFTFAPGHTNVLLNGQRNDAIGAYLAQIGIANTANVGPGQVAYLGLADMPFSMDDDFQDQVIKVTATCGVPLAAIAGPWTFMTSGIVNSPMVSYLGSGGTFTASIGTDRAGNPTGLLTVLQTIAQNASITRLETDAGRYWVDPATCTSGTLTFNTSSRPVQFYFYLVNGTEMVLVGSNNGDVVSGVARRSIPVVCTSPALNVAVGDWVFSLKEYDLVRAVPQIAAGGIFTINPDGSLNSTQTVGVYGGNSQQEMVSGRAFVNEGCGGGYLSFSLAGRPFQADYFFASANRMILAGTISGNILTGEARRVGTTD